MFEYLIGIDGGGTKTSLRLADLSGNKMEDRLGGPSNLNSCPEQEVCATFASLFSGIPVEKVGAFCLGAAGAGSGSVKDRLRDLLKGLGFTKNVVVTEDGYTALEGSLEGGAGVNLVSGTGSVCYGRGKDGTIHRVGGYGHIIDDGGSGYALGRDILSAIVRAYDGRGVPTVLSGLFQKETGLKSIDELVDFVYNKNTDKSKIASLARLLDDSSVQNDAASAALAENNMRALVDCVDTVIKRASLAGSEPIVTVSGSALKNVWLREMFLRQLLRLYPDVSVMKPKHDAVWGAVHIARRLYLSKEVE